MAMSPVCPGSHSDFPWQGAKRGWLAKRFSTSDLPSSWRVVNMAAPSKRGEDFSKHMGKWWKMEHDGKYWENVGNIMKHLGNMSDKVVCTGIPSKHNFKRENMGTCCTQRCSPPSQNECWPPRCWSLRGFHFGSKWTHCIGIYWDSVTPRIFNQPVFLWGFSHTLGIWSTIVSAKTGSPGLMGFERMIWGNHIETAPGGQMDLSILFKCLHLG